MARPHHNRLKQLPSVSEWSQFPALLKDFAKLQPPLVRSDRINYYFEAIARFVYPVRRHQSANEELIDLHGESTRNLVNGGAAERTTRQFLSHVLQHPAPHCRSTFHADGVGGTAAPEAGRSTRRDQETARRASAPRLQRAIVTPKQVCFRFRAHLQLSLLKRSRIWPKKLAVDHVRDWHIINDYESFI